MKLAKMAVAGAVGLLAGSARGDEAGWRKPGEAAPPAPIRAVPPAVVTPAPAFTPAPVRAPSSAPAPTHLPQWRTTSPDETVWVPARSSIAPPATLVLTPIQDPPKPTPPTTQPVPPIVIPKVPPSGKPEAAPLPRDVKPSTLPTPRPMGEGPKPLGMLPSATSPGTGIVSTAATDVWGSYAPCDAARPVSTVPVRHHTYGSPDMRLSRDYHFLDALAKPLASTSQGVIVEDAEPESLTDRFFVQTEYLQWWVRRASIPALATTADNRLFGFLGQPGTTLLLGPGEFGSSQRNGFRVRGGMQFANHDTLGIDASYFFLADRTDSRSFASPQFPTILRPFFPPNFNAEFGELVSFPGLSTGRLDVSLSSSLWGADVNLRKGLICGCDRRLAAFAGYRYLDMHETLTIREDLTAGPDAPDPEGTRITVLDRFDTKNIFHGGQLGLAAFRRWGRVALDARASVALGSTHQILTIDGAQTRQRPGQPVETFTGGLLAVGPNLGRFTRDRFSVVPEFTLNVGYFLTPNLQVYAGYNFLYWSNVIRPGDQIDRVVDLTFVPNAPPVPPSGQIRPLPTFRQTDFWAHGLQFGIALRW